MYYEINISLNGQHFFATSNRSITDGHKLKMVYGVLKEKFPSEDGYKISVTKYETIGKPMSMEKE